MYAVLCFALREMALPQVPFYCDGIHRTGRWKQTTK